MRTLRHPGILLLCLGLPSALRAEEAGDRPLLSGEGGQGAAGTSTLPEDAAGGNWRSATRLGKAPKAPVPEPISPRAEEDAPPPVEAPRPALQQRYQGVAPGRAELPPHPPKLPLGKGPQRLTWPGFQIKDGRPTLFLQLSGPVEYSVSQRPGEVLVTLHDTVVPLRNNLRPLLVSDFHTPVQRVHFERQPKKGTVTAVVSVKGAVAHTERMESAENGYQMLLVQFSPFEQGRELTRETQAPVTTPSRALPAPEGRGLPPIGGAGAPSK